MKSRVLLLLLLVASIAGAQPLPPPGTVLPTLSTRQLKTAVIDWQLTAAPPVSDPGACRTYFDGTTQLWTTSCNGAAYVAVKPVSVIPSGHTDITSPFDTTSATLVDITGSSTTVTNTITAPLVVLFTGDVTAVGGAASCVINYTVSVDGTDASEFSLNFDTPDTEHAAALSHITSAVSAGTHTILGRMRRVSGTCTARFLGGMVSLIALQGGS